MKPIIASLPRSGSTYLLRSVYGYADGEFTPEELKDVKFHYPLKKFWDVYLHNDCRIIFTFRDIYHVVYSMFLHRMDTNSFKNCGLDEWDSEELELHNDLLLEKDILNYELIFDFWTWLPGVMCVRYDVINLYRYEIEMFLQRKVEWLDWRPHEYEISDGLREIISDTYKNLNHKINCAKKFKINEG